MAGMENDNRPPGEGPQDQQPTEQFWPSQGAPAGQQGYAQPPGQQAHVGSGRRKALGWTVGITVAALLAGGAIAGVALASPSVTSAPAASTGSAMAGQSGAAAPGSQAALLDAALTAADSPAAALSSTAAGATGVASAGQSVTGSGTGTPAGRCARALAAARAARRSGHPLQAGATARFAFRCHVRRRIIRFFLLHGVDGQFTFRTRTGALKTLAYQRGVIESVNGSTSIVVKAADGTVWTWGLVSNTVVRESGGKISESALASGAEVWLGGPVINGSKDARLIFLRPPGGTS
jgi:hypothetical protein